MQDSAELLKQLLINKIEFVLVGGYAAVAYGVNTLTQDVDICFHFTPENITKLLQTLAPYQPVHRRLSDSLPITQSVEDLTKFKNLYLNTNLGRLDLLGIVGNLGNYEQIGDRTETIDLFGYPCKILDIPSLIQSKAYMGRPKDQQVIIELRAIEAQEGNKK